MCEGMLAKIIRGVETCLAPNFTVERKSEGGIEIAKLKNLRLDIQIQNYERCMAVMYDERYRDNI